MPEVAGLCVTSFAFGHIMPFANWLQSRISIWNTRVSDPTEDAQSLFNTAETLKATKLGEADAGCIVAERQGDIDALEETVRNRETITAKYAKRDRRVAPVREARRARQKLRSNLEGDQTLNLPYEVMAEIFILHMLMDGSWVTRLLVCKRWTMVAYSSPRLWARISVTNHSRFPRYLRGSVICTNPDRLRSVLSLSRSCPLQVEISFTLIMTPDGMTNRNEAVKFILDDQILRRCTELVLANDFLPSKHQNKTVLPLLSSIRIYSVGKGHPERQLIQSLVDLSPALRHIRYEHSLRAEHEGVGLWTKRIESYSWISPSAPCSLLHESPSLRKLGIRKHPDVPLTLPALQVLKWSIDTYAALHWITAPQLHTLILRHDLGHTLFQHESASSISFPTLRVAIHTRIHNPKVVHMFVTPALEHLSITYQSSDPPAAALPDLFDGSTHMPTPKSLYLDCTFIDATLIAVLGRLPWLEELQVAGSSVEDTFWKRLTPSCNPGLLSIAQRVVYGERATDTLVPNLKTLLVHYPPGAMKRVSKYPGEVSSGGGWKQLPLAAAEARKQAGCPFRTLACCYREHRPKVLIGSLDNVPKRPKFVSLTARWCY